MWSHHQLTTYMSPPPPLKKNMNESPENIFICSFISFIISLSTLMHSYSANYKVIYLYEPNPKSFIFPTYIVSFPYIRTDTIFHYGATLHIHFIKGWHLQVIWLYLQFFYYSPHACNIVFHLCLILLIQIPGTCPKTFSSYLPSTMSSHNDHSFILNTITLILIAFTFFFRIYQQNVLSSHSDPLQIHHRVLDHFPSSENLTPILLISSFTSLTTPSMKSQGEITHHCLTLLLNLNDSLSPSLSFTQVTLLTYVWYY